MPFVSNGERKETAILRQPMLIVNCQHVNY